jgi:hypothetical protein
MNELESTQKKETVALSRYYPNISLKDHRKTTKNLVECSRCSRGNLNGTIGRNLSTGFSVRLKASVHM